MVVFARSLLRGDAQTSMFGDAVRPAALRGVASMRNWRVNGISLSARTSA